MRINNNITAINAHRNYTVNSSSIGKNVEKLSSGYRINRAGDDAAGLAISEKMRAQIRGLNMASKNSQDAVSLIQTAEGALQSTHNVLQRMRELAVQSASDTNEQTVDRAALQAEFAQLKAEIDDTAAKTRFNDQNLIDGTFQSVRNTSTMTGVLEGNVSLANKAQSGVYNFGVKQVTTGDVVGVIPTMGGVSTGKVGTGVNASGSNAVDIAAISQYTDSFNGTWEIGFNEATSTFEAKNLVNGKILTATINTAADIAVGDTYEIDFGSGMPKVTLELTGAHALNTSGSASDLANFGAAIKGTQFDISGGVSPVIGETKFYATLDGANDVEIRAGDKSATFNNGITVNFNNAFTFADLAKEVATGADGLDHANDSAFDISSTHAAEITIIGQKQSGLIIQTGANEKDELQITIDEMNCRALNISTSSISTRTAASRAISEVNDAINQVSTQRAELGALQNRLDFKIANLDTSAENLQAAESRIRDVDMAKEMTMFTKNNILFQASTAMLAQANALPQGVLQLLG